MFNINGYDWQVYLVSANHPMLTLSNGSWTFGVCDHNTLSIYIYEDLNEDQFYRVLAHEITHAAMFSYGIFLTYEQEELVADLVGTYGDEIIDNTNYVFNKLIQKRKWGS